MAEKQSVLHDSLEIDFFIVFPEREVDAGCLWKQAADIIPE